MARKSNLSRGEMIFRTSNRRFCSRVAQRVKSVEDLRKRWPRNKEYRQGRCCTARIKDWKPREMCFLSNLKIEDCSLGEIMPKVGTEVPAEMVSKKPSASCGETVAKK